jgi:hypothetical protein
VRGHAGLADRHLRQRARHLRQRARHLRRIRRVAPAIAQLLWNRARRWYFDGASPLQRWPRSRSWPNADQIGARSEENPESTFIEASEFTPRAWPNLTKHLDPRWAEEALSATRTAMMRRCRLPAEQTVWLVLGWRCAGPAGRDGSEAVGHRAARARRPSDGGARRTDASAGAPWSRPDGVVVIRSADE